MFDKDYITAKSMGKSTILQNMGYLQNVGLMSLIKKEMGGYYTRGA